MYNLREEAKKFHEKGRGNGYVIEKNDKRVYISGDTEDIPEMRSLQNIDIAFVCMNLPYTMTVENAASAVLDFKPNKVYPYHYRGTEGLSDVSKFKSLVKNFIGKRGSGAGAGAFNIVNKSPLEICVSIEWLKNGCSQLYRL